LVLFFDCYSKWKWPKPVTLVPPLKTPPNGVSPMSVWNPQKNHRDGSHLMPILTPAYPSMNSSFNVGRPQLKRMKEEFLRGNQIVKSIISKQTEKKQKQ